MTLQAIEAVPVDMTPHFPIYMDYGATTPVDQRVVDAMIPWLREHFGNPASRSHAWGWEAEAAVEKAREQVAALINADPREIIWTSGATESDNLAIKGAAQFYKTRGKHLITVKTEHKAVLDTMRELERQGFEVTYLDVQEDGLLDLDKLKAAMRPDTILVSVMFVNNEIGVIQDIADDRRDVPRARHHLPRRRRAGDRQGGDRPGQAAGRPDEPGLAQDLRPEGHRRALRAPQAARPHRGADARRRPRARHALGHAADASDRRHGRGLSPGPRGDGHRDRAHPHAAQRSWSTASRDIEQTFLNGHPTQRVPHNVNMSFNYVEGESLIMGVKGIAVSSGSACTSASLEPSYVLRALGRSDELAHSSLRMTIGRFTTEEEIDYVVSTLKDRVAKLRELSPLWDMYQEGIDISTIQWAAH